MARPTTDRTASTVYHMPVPAHNGRSQSVERQGTNSEQRSPPIQRVPLAQVTARLPPIPPLRTIWDTRRVIQPHQPEANNPLPPGEIDRLYGSNQTDAILYETKDLLRDLLQKAGQIEQLLRIIHYNLPPVGRTHHAPLQQAQPQRPDAQ